MPDRGAVTTRVCGSGSRPGLVLVVPVKRLALAKSRLEVEPAERRRIALALAEHTVSTALACPEVTAVVVVTSDRTVRRRLRARGATLVPEPRHSSLNDAARLGRRQAARRAPGADLGILVSDLPGLEPEHLSEAIAMFRRTASPLLVPDHEGTGTTLLLHGPGTWPAIGFGPDSAARHRAAGYLAWPDAADGLRHDFDRSTERQEPWLLHT